MDVLLVLLSDGEVHVALPGHVNALCGAARTTNADVTTDDVTCDKCLLAYRATLPEKV